MAEHPLETIDVIAPNFKKRLSGVTATVVRLVPVQARSVAIRATGPVLPDHVPQVPLGSLPTMSRKGPSGTRVWHARRNVEMIGGLALKYLLGKKLRLVFTSASQRQQTWLTRWLIRQMDTVVATSSKTASYLEGPSTVIMHGIDLDDFTPPKDRSALRARLGVPDKGPVFGCYGRIRAQKGTDVFVDAMIQVLQETPDAAAIVMGRATEQYKEFDAGLRQKVDEAGLSDRLLFKPEVPTEAMADWYRVLDVYVAPQRWEGFGLTPIEAMACACPVVATRVGAFEDLVVEGATGRLIPAGDVDDMVAACRDVISDRARLHGMREQSRNHVEQNFSIQKEADALNAIYLGLLGKASNTSAEESH